MAAMKVTVHTFNSCTSRPDVCQCLVVQTPMDIVYKRISQAHQWLVSKKLRSVVRSSIHPCPGNWVAVGRAVEYISRAALAFSAGIKCQHCTCPTRRCKDFINLRMKGFLQLVAEIPPNITMQKRNIRRQIDYEMYI